MTRHLALVLALVLAAACGKASHSDLDDWMDTEKGPGKLRDTVADSGADADISAHAAQNLLIIGQADAVTAAFDKLTPERRTAVLTKLAPRLWKLARIEGELTVASAQQSSAKDLLFALRDKGDATTEATIDGYLIEWFTSGYYQDRSGRGTVTGDVALRAIGPAAGPAMIRAANAVISAPAQGKARALIGDQVLLGLAVTGDPAAVKLALDLVKQEERDPKLPERAVRALWYAYVEPPGGLFPKADPAGLTPNLPALGAIARDTDHPAGMLNDTFDLIEAAGAPGCITALVPLIARPEGVRYLWVAAQHALSCGKIGSISQVVDAMPESGDYEHEALLGAIVDTIAKMEPREQVLIAARTLVASASPIARWVGIEVLAKLGSTDDAARIAGLAKDKTVLQGYWEEGSGKGKMTLGKRAAELSKALQ